MSSPNYHHCVVNNHTQGIPPWPKRAPTTHGPRSVLGFFWLPDSSLALRASYMRQRSTMPLEWPQTARQPLRVSSSSTGGRQLTRSEPTSRKRLISCRYFCFLFLAFLFVINAAMFDTLDLNYHFIFGLDKRDSINWRQLSEIPSAFACILGVCMWLNFHPSIGPDTMYIYWPIVLIGVSTSRYASELDSYSSFMRTLLVTLWLLLTRHRSPFSCSSLQHQDSSTPAHDGGYPLPYTA